MYVASLFLSAGKASFLSCAEQLKQNTVLVLKHNCMEGSNYAFLSYCALKIFHSTTTQRVKTDGTLYLNVTKKISGTN